ncbi:MAG: hypothetical protein H0X17_16540, partial [Deltaproteobacteria bacterium]|nr:hypothetical protein [Deltaproteobacteria bacterium]
MRAQAEPMALMLHADAERTGWIRLVVTGRTGASATVQETVGGRTQPIADVGLAELGSATLPAAAIWRCDRRERHFTATAIAPDGAPESATTTITTPSCRDRIAFSTRPRRPRAERPVIVRVRDRWRVGDLSAKVCVRPPGTPRAHCRSI